MSVISISLPSFSNTEFSLNVVIAVFSWQTLSGKTLTNSLGFRWNKITCNRRTPGIRTELTLKVLTFWKFTSYCSLKPLWSGIGEAVPACTSPTLHPPSPPTVHQLSRLALLRVNNALEEHTTTHMPPYYTVQYSAINGSWFPFFMIIWTNHCFIPVLHVQPSPWQYRCLMDHHRSQTHDDRHNPPGNGIHGYESHAQKTDQVPGYQESMEQNSGWNA